VNKRHQILLATSLILLISLACTISLGSPTTTPSLSQEDLLNTAVAQTIAAGQQVIVPTATTGVVVVAPTQTTVSQPTNTPIPCNRPTFISETVPDGTSYTPNTNFTKSWRWRNDGTCTWNTNYQVVYFSGDQMGGPAVKNFTQNVAPGEYVDISVDLKSPGTAGTYKGYWKLRDDKGNYFVNNMWVQIVVPGLAPPVVGQPDLIISEFSLNPATPTMGQNVHVRVGAYNQGNVASGTFIVRWYGLSTFAGPSCAWVLPSMVAKGGQILECDYVFASWYPVNKTTIVYIDHDSQVAESNESNNSASISPFGVLAP